MGRGEGRLDKNSGNFLKPSLTAVTIKTKKGGEREGWRKNSHNLGIVTGNGPNNFQPVARKCPRKRLVMPRPCSFFFFFRPPCLSTGKKRGGGAEKKGVCTFPPSFELRISRLYDIALLHEISLGKVIFFPPPFEIFQNLKTSPFFFFLYTESLYYRIEKKKNGRWKKRVINFFF